MVNQTAYALGSVRSYIREVFEYGRQQAKICLLYTSPSPRDCS